jgi:hypothetical protein
MKTQSFTLRIPSDLMEEIKAKTGDRGKSEFIIQTLRDALGVELRKFVIDPQVTDQITTLTNQFEEFKLHIDEILKRIEKIEETPKQVTTQITPELKKTRETIEEIKLPLEIPNEIPDEAKCVDGKTLLNLFRKIEPSNGWNVAKLRVKRQGRAATRWHQIGEYKFIYKGKRGGEGTQTEHEWWVTSPSETTTSSS